MTVTALTEVLQLLGPLFQMSTALTAASIGVITVRYTKRQNALTLINQNNALANLVNTTVIQSEAARGVLARADNVVVGCPDDAVLLMYLNYVHNTFRMHQAGAVGAQVWRDTLASCVGTVGRLRRDQLQALLGRGYEAAFQAAVLGRYDAAAPEVVATLRPRLRVA